MSNTIIAKTIVPDTYWILTDGNSKVGNILVDGSGVEVKLNGSTSHYGDLQQALQHVRVTFIEGGNIKPSEPLPIEDLPIDGNCHNVMHDIKRKLQLYTKTVDSKCYHVAGWFNLRAGDKWTTVLCPKYIYIQRYSWRGPYRTMEQATAMLQSDKYVDDKH